MMTHVQRGDTVKVHYTGKLDDGTIFDSSTERKPITLIIGEKRMMPAFEESIIGMEPGQERTVTIQAEQAFGVHQDDLVRVIGRNVFPPNLEPSIGQRLSATHVDGRTVPVTVVDFSDSTVTIDANHPLAGEDLTFDIELLEII